MKYFFGQELDTCGIDTDLMFTTKEGDAFYYQVEFGTNAGGTDDIVIADNIGRAVPVSVDALPSLIIILTQVLKINSILEEVSNMENMINDPQAVVLYD